MPNALPTNCIAPNPNVAASSLLQNKRDKKGWRHHHAQPPSKSQNTAGLLICYFTRFWRRRCCWSFREKVTDEHVCAHRGPRAAALKCAAQKLMKRSENGKGSQEKRVRYKWLDFSIWQINRKGDIPFEVGWAKVSTHCMANVSPGPGSSVRTDPSVTAQNLDRDDRFDDKMVISPLFSCSGNFVTGC